MFSSEWKCPVRFICSLSNLRIWITWRKTRLEVYREWLRCSEISGSMENYTEMLLSKWFEGLTVCMYRWCYDVKKSAWRYKDQSWAYHRKRILFQLPKSWLRGQAQLFWKNLCISAECTKAIARRTAAANAFMYFARFIVRVKPYSKNTKNP